MSSLELSHAAVGKILDRTACKRSSLSETTATTKGMQSGKEGPSRLVSVKATATMATTAAQRFTALGMMQDDPDRRIDTAVTRRLSLAPELGGGRKTARHVAPVLGMAPVDLSLTTLMHVHKLISAELELNPKWPSGT